MKCAVLVAVLVLFSGSAQGQFVMPGPPDVCVRGIHKPSPSPESEALEACGAWQTLSCCTANTTMSINRTMALGLYNFSWELCGPLSQDCLNYMEVHRVSQNCLFTSLVCLLVVVVIVVLSFVLMFRMKCVSTNVSQCWATSATTHLLFAMSQYVPRTATAGSKLAGTT